MPPDVASCAHHHRNILGNGAWDVCVFMYVCGSTEGQKHCGFPISVLSFILCFCTLIVYILFVIFLPL